MMSVDCTTVTVDPLLMLHQTLEAWLLPLSSVGPVLKASRANTVRNSHTQGSNTEGNSSYLDESSQKGRC